LPRPPKNSFETTYKPEDCIGLGNFKVAYSAVAAFRSPLLQVYDGTSRRFAQRLDGEFSMKQFTRRNLLRCSGMAAASLALQTRGIAWAQSALLAPLATTTAGKVSGFIADGVNVFKGIPYGGDTAKTRFKAPAPPAPWTGVMECTRFAAMAPQLMTARANPGAAARVARGISGWYSYVHFSGRLATCGGIFRNCSGGSA
jgi:hypothetical protein